MFPSFTYYTFAKIQKAKNVRTPAYKFRKSAPKIQGKGGGVNATQTFFTLITPGPTSPSPYWKRGLTTHSPLCPRKRLRGRIRETFLLLPKKVYLIYRLLHCTVVWDYTVRGSSKGLFFVWEREHWRNFLWPTPLIYPRTSSSPANIWWLKKRSGKKVVKNLPSDGWAQKIN